MKVLFDTNVIIDIWKKSSEFFFDSFCAYDVCMLRKWQPYIAATAVPDIEYLLSARGILKKDQVGNAMDNLFEMFSVADMQECDCLLARKSDMPDFEDGVIAHSAARNAVDTIVTRNIKDFRQSPVPAMTPEDFVSAFAPGDVEYAEVDFWAGRGEVAERK